MKHSLEKRLEAVQRYLNGEASTFLEKELGIDHSEIVVYALRFKKDGIAGLEDRPGRWWTAEEKRATVMDYVNESLTLAEVAVKHDVSFGTLKVWLRTYRREGIDSLKDRHFFPRLKSLMARFEKDPTKMTKEELQELVKDLAAENALLKKVKALVEKREAQEQATGSKPSKN